MSKKSSAASARIHAMQEEQAAAEKRRQTLRIGALMAVIIVCVVGIGIAVQYTRDTAAEASRTRSSRTWLPNLEQTRTKWRGAKKTRRSSIGWTTRQMRRQRTMSAARRRSSSTARSSSSQRAKTP